MLLEKSSPSVPSVMGEKFAEFVADPGSEVPSFGALKQPVKDTNAVAEIA